MNDENLMTDNGEPQVAELIEEFQRCSPYQSGWHKLATSEATRFCRWEGQDPSGKKYDRNMPEGKKAFPFDGASDARTFNIDEAIEEIVAIEFVAFFKSMLRVSAVESGDLGAVSYINKLLQWVMGTKQFASLRREVELHSQYTHTYGWSVLHVAWLQEHVLRLVTATLEEIVRMAEGARAQAAQGLSSPQNEIAQALPAIIMDPARDAEFAAVMVQIVPGLTPKRARQMARDLRETGKAAVPMPHLAKDEPMIRALKPWEEVYISNTATDIQQGRVFVKEWLNATQLKSMVYTDGWNAAWVEEAIKRKGEVSSFGAATAYGSNAVAADALRMTGDGFAVYEAGGDLIEVIHAYTRRLDEDNVPGIYRTTFHAGIASDPKHPHRELCAKHELLDYRHGQMPFIIRKREEWARTITSSRGLPEIFFSTQRSYKSQEDGVVDSTSLSVMPPIIVPEMMGVEYTFGPGQQIPETIPGRAPRSMDFRTPGVPVAFEVMQLLDRRIGRRIGRKYADESPEGADAQRQRLVQGNLVSWSEAFQQEFALIEQFMPAEKFMRITGAPAAPSADAESITGEYDLILTFDVGQLSMDYVMKELQAIKDVVLPVDAMGRIDRGKLVELLLRAIDPTLAKELLLDQQSASQQIFQKVKLDMLGMMAGFEAEYVEMDPTAHAQLQFAKQLVQTNPRIQQAAQQDERFRELFGKWEQNRMQSVMQQQNKMVGRIGVNPESAVSEGGQA